jgi:diguanylate cyclase (GGDEF)-like protein
MRQTRILLIDDNAHHRRLLLMSLVQGRPTLHVVVTDSRQGMIDAARECQFDCIVMDYNVPPYSAPTLIDDIRAIHPETPILVISSSHEQQVVIDALRYGVADFVKKEDAIKSDLLKTRIDSAIVQARKQRQERREANRRLQSLKDQADTDPLTGLLNRRGGLRFLNSDRARHDRRAQTAVIMIDLDNFKQINDTYGHALGDAVLQSTGKLLASHAQGSDAMIRWGGEEFLVLRPSASMADAWGWADRIRQAIETTTVTVDGVSVLVTSSLGVDVFPTHELNESIITRADRAMYLAKESGRNRVCTWRMIEAMEIAEELQTNAALSTRQRLRLLLDRLRAELGIVQLEHTGPHCVRVMRLAERLGRSMGIHGDDLQDLSLASEFHDIGKVAAPESLLAAPRKLDIDEQRIVNEHARFGAELFTACGCSGPAIEAVAHHHDHYSMGGRSSHEGSPSKCMILAVADSVVAMMSDRNYAERKTASQALSELRAERGRQFHPEVVDAVHFLDRSALRCA